MKVLLALVLASGLASWYDDGPGLYAAVHSYRWGDPRYQVQVCRQDDPSKCVTVTVRDYCQCHVGTRAQKAIDLSPAAFARLAPLSSGVVKVFIRPVSGPAPKSVGGAEPTPPPTDTSDALITNIVDVVWYWISTMEEANGRDPGPAVRGPLRAG